MKVKELIRQLQQYDPEARVYYGSSNGRGDAEILTTSKFANCRDVIIEDASQFDVGSELVAMLDLYGKKGADESDAYQEMVDRGFTPDVLDEYLGDGLGEHMREYCMEHGIE